MKRLRIICILIGLTAWSACSDLFLGDDPTSTPVNNFESFWQGFNNYYGGFVNRSINWDSVYTVYRPQVNAQMTDAELLSIFISMIKPLKDPHINIFAKRFNTYYYPRLEGNFLSPKSKYITNLKWDHSIAHGFLDNNLGYIYINHFDNTSESYNQIDQIVEEFQNLKGVIIDVRNNGGGQVGEAYKIASRFADGKYLYAYSREKIGPGRTTLSDFLPSYITPSGKKQFTKSLAILTNQRTTSAAELMTLMIRSYPHVIHVGVKTRGGIGGPITRELPNGWTYTLSPSVMYPPDKTIIEGIGIVPDEIVTISKADSIAGTDTILERAMDLLK